MTDRSAGTAATPDPVADRRTRMLGWAFVAVQAVLLVALVALPSRDDWPVPSWLRAVGTGMVVAGIVLVGVASLRLGSSLTPTPVPNQRGSLATTGLYRFVRHPIYSGVLTITVGLVVGSGSVATLVVGLITVAFFNVKAAWEEDRLAARYPGYAAYAGTTPRFVPKPRRRTAGT